MEGWLDVKDIYGSSSFINFNLVTSIGIKGRGENTHVFKFEFTNSESTLEFYLDQKEARSIAFFLGLDLPE